MSTPLGETLFREAFTGERSKHLKILKYPIPIADRVEADIPPDGYTKILCVQTQPDPKNPKEDRICIWALVDTSYGLDVKGKQRKGVNIRAFHVVGTGHEFPMMADPERYIGTVQLEEGRIVYHVFEERS